jgi:hypothetical protein
MKNRTRYYGRDFCGNIEMECIVNSALTSVGEYRATRRICKEYCHELRITYINVLQIATNLV